MRSLLKIAVLTLLAGFIGIVNADPPATSGIVTRSNEPIAIFAVDTDAGMGAIFGGDIGELCLTGATEFDVIPFSVKTIRDGVRFSIIGHGEVTTSVWPFTVFDCNLFLTVPPLAMGTASMVMHDNDLFAPYLCEQKNNNNSAGFQAHGRLYTPFGEPKQFSIMNHTLFDCETLTVELAKTKIKLTR